MTRPRSTTSQADELGATLASLKSRIQAVELLAHTPCATTGLVPTGSLVPFAGATAPPDWVLCDGQAVSRTTYADLFALVGITYGVGDGSTTFNVPDLRGRVIVGLDAGQTEFDALNETGGAKTHTHGSSAMIAGANIFGSNPFYIDYNARGYGSGYTENTRLQAFATTNIYTSHSETNNSGIGIFGNTDNGSSLQPYRVLNYIIKA